MVARIRKPFIIKVLGFLQFIIPFAWACESSIKAEFNVCIIQVHQKHSAFIYINKLRTRILYYMFNVHVT